MDYDVAGSKERLTGRAYFNPNYTVVGSVPTSSMTWLDLGNIQLMNLDYGIKRKEHYKARRGALITDRYDAYSTTPRWEITGDEFVSSTLFLIFLGTDVANLSINHGATSAPHQQFNSLKGGVLDTGHFAIFGWSIVAPGGLGTEGVDYIVDPGPGKLYVPQTSSWTDGSSHNFSYSWPTIAFDQILPPLSNLNRSGVMQLYEEDDSGPAGTTGFMSGVAGPKTVHSFPVSLSTDSGGQTKVDDYKSFKMIATVTDPTSWTILKRTA